MTAEVKSLIRNIADEEEAAESPYPVAAAAAAPLPQRLLRLRPYLGNAVAVFGALAVCGGGARHLWARRLGPVQQLFSTDGYGGGKPRFFCFAVMQPSGMEPELIRTQWARGAGIFGCQDYAVYSVDSVPIGGGDYTVGIGSLQTAVGGTGPDGTPSWTNVEPFLKAWSAVANDGRYMRFPWTVKADPDAVFLPATLFGHLQQASTGRSEYFSTCLGVKFGFYGALEVISRDGVVAYLNNMEPCRQRLGWSGWGEDLFAQVCMDQSGVQRKDDDGIVADRNCHAEPAPCTSGHAAFHPFKDVDAWMQCWFQAGGPAQSQGDVRPGMRGVEAQAQQDIPDLELEVPRYTDPDQEAQRQFLEDLRYTDPDRAAEHEMEGLREQRFHDPPASPRLYDPMDGPAEFSEIRPEVRPEVRIAFPGVERHHDRDMSRGSWFWR